MDLAPGSVFAGDYRIVAPLSSGGMGAVFVVEQLSTGKRRALKLMHRELAADPMSRQRFEQEARVGARIASEHVVEVQAAGVDVHTRLPYLVMELLEGEDMASRLRRGPFAPHDAAAVLAQLAHAMGAAHDAGVVHRDLKPENIFLGVQQRMGSSLIVKVLDFGIAKVMEGHNRTTGAYGTPMWLAPEQTQRTEITPAADVWAFGLVTFAMLVGHPFWHSADGGPNASLSSLIQEIVRDPIPMASSRAAEFAVRLPDGFDAWFACVVTRDPRARFPNARVAYAALAPILSVATPPQSALHVTAARTSLPAPRSAAKTLVVAAAALVLVLGSALAAVAFLVMRDQRAVATTPSSFAPTIAPMTPSVMVASTAPSAMVVTAEPERVAHVGGLITSSNADLQKDAQKLFNETLAEKLNGCLARSLHRKSGSVTLMAKVKVDGSIASVQSLSMEAAPNAQCMIEVVEGAKLGPRNRGAEVIFAIFWNER